MLDGKDDRRKTPVYEMGGNECIHCADYVKKSNPEVAKTYINSCTVSTLSIGSTILTVRQNGNIVRQLTLYVKNGFIESGDKIVDGILRQAEDGDWTIRWQIFYDENASGIKSNAQLYIYLEGADRNDGSLMLYSMLGNGFLMPWLTEEYGFQKSDFNRIYVRGGRYNAFEIISNQFSGYSNVRTVKLSRVRLMQSEAFSNCSSLEALFYDGWVTFVGDRAFKNCLRLNSFYNLAQIDYIETIGDEAFMNTEISSFSFDKVVKIGKKAFANTRLGQIILDTQVYEIGEEAFADCEELLICCYNESYAYEYAVENKHRYKVLVDKKYADWGKKAGTISPVEYAILNKFCTDVSNRPTTGEMEDAMYECLKYFPLGHPLHVDENPDLCAINESQIEAGNRLIKELHHFGYNTYLTGYSLGGHIAEDVALKCKELAECVTFDSPGRGDTAFIGDSYNNKITNYINEGSTVSQVGSQVGTVYRLDVEENWLINVVHNHDIYYAIKVLGGEEFLGDKWKQFSEGYE